MTIALCCFLLLIAVAMSGFYSGSETGLYSMDRLHLKVRADHGDQSAVRLERLVRNEQSALSTLLIGTNVANYLATVSVAYILAHSADLGGASAEIYTTLLVTPIIFVFGEVVPKNIYQRHADRLMYSGSRLFYASSVVLRLPVRILGRVSRPILALFDPSGLTATTDPRSNIAVLLREALVAERGSDEVVELVDRVLSLRSVALYEVMAPRNRVVSIHADATREECLAMVRSNPHSRLPVYDRDPRRIIGYVEIHTLLADESWSGPRKHLKPVVSFEAHETVASALLRLQSAQETLAVVTDRNGLLLGIATLKDLLEELTGELHAW